MDSAVLYGMLTEPSIQIALACVVISVVVGECWDGEDQPASWTTSRSFFGVMYTGDGG